MKKELYLIKVNIKLLLTELLFFINGIFLFDTIPKVVPTFSGKSSHAIFSLRQVIYFPREYFLSFFCFLMGLVFLSGVLVRGLLYCFYQWKITGFILKFCYTSWSLSIFSTTFYLSFHFMAIEGLIIGLFLCITYIFFYFSKVTHIHL